MSSANDSSDNTQQQQQQQQAKDAKDEEYEYDEHEREEEDTAAKKSQRKPRDDSGIIMPLVNKFVHRDANFARMVPGTHEDKFHLHKTLGILSVLSFVYRYAYVYPTTGTLGFDGQSKLDWMSLIVHALLAFSAIVFRVPARRIADKPFIIYEEYRLHAIVFTSRSVIVAALALFAATHLGGGGGTNNLQEGQRWPDLELPLWLIPVIVMVCHLLVDEITRRHGTPGYTAVRSKSERIQMTSFYKRVALFYSFYQFAGLGAMLLPSPRLADSGFNGLIAIQSSAVLMTLYRKRIITGRAHVAVYSFCLLLSLFHIVRIIGIASSLLVLATFLVRINLPRDFLFGDRNKYPLWALYTIVGLWMQGRLDLPTLITGSAANVSSSIASYL